MEVNTNIGWPNCSWGLLQHYIGWRVVPEVEGAENGCELTYFGNDFGNDTPAWSNTYFEFYDWQIDFLPEICFGGIASSQDTAPVTDEETTTDAADETATASL